MPREKPRTVKLHKLAVGQPPADFFALLIEKNRLTTRDGKPYFKCKFRDRRRCVESVVWPDAPLFADCEAAWKVGIAYKIRGHYSEHEKYGPNIEVIVIREANAQDREDGLNDADLSERSRFDSEKMFAELIGLANDEIADAPLRQLVLNLLNTHAESLKVLPASPKAFFPFPGGWLEHVLNVTRNALWLADQYAARYPDLKPFNRDLIVAGAMLHDIGRVAEFATGELTVPGHLFGHVILGRDLIRDTARAVPDLNPELLQLLEHIVLAHLTKPEWGSPRLPMIPEVLVLHNADDLDAKFEMYARHLMNDQKEGPVSDFDPVLKRPLLKGRSV